jgi:hypothetical protein
VEGRKQAVSIRLNAADLHNLRRLAHRMGVRYSDIIRLAIKSTLSRADMVRYLDLDVASLDAIINGAAPEQNRVERADIRLLANLGAKQPILRLRLAGAPVVRDVQNGPVDLDESEEDLPLNKMPAAMSNGRHP